MKYFKNVLFAVLLFSIIFSLNENVFSQSPRMKDRFYLGAVNFFFINGLRTQQNLPWYSELSYNTQVSFCANLDTFPTVWISFGMKDGGFFEPLSNYQSYCNTVLSDWYGIANNNSLLYEREKIQRPAFGQRSTYIVTNPGGHPTSEFPAYYYQTYTTGRDYKDNDFAGGVWVRRCLLDSDAVGFMVKSLYENCEQINNITYVSDSANSSSDRFFSDVKEPKYGMRWFIKPRLRIDSVYAKNNPNDTVCVLYVNRFDGRRLDTFPIFCKNFCQYYSGIYYYNERYLEMFYQVDQNGNNPTAFSVDAWALQTGRNPDNTANSQVDYYIKWWGKVDTYLQYIRVDDSWAHYLFTDSSGTNPLWNFHQKIQEEVNAFAVNNQYNAGYFWLEEIPYNSIPCYEEVNRLVKQYSNNQSSLLAYANLDNMVRGHSFMKKEYDWNNDYFPYLDSLFVNNYISNILPAELYPFNFDVYYPSNVSSPDPGIYPTSTYYSKASSTEQYNESIQSTINWNNFFHKTNIFYAKKYGVQYLVNFQVHSDDGNIDPNSNPRWGLREPTNEEIRLQAYEGLAYGAKILNEYTYYSQNQSAGHNTWGLLDMWDTNYIAHNKRIINMYGQAKWDSTVRLNQKLVSMGNYMYPTGQTNKFLQHDYTISVNSGVWWLSNLPYSYLSNILSYSIDGGGTWDNPNTLQQDPENKRYYDIGFYNDPNNSLKKYMLVVNKRCVPVQGGLGDLRTIKFYFTGLNNFNNWVLKDVMTGESVTFDKNSTVGVYFPHPFQPGEGKLFRLAPVMVTGGTFVCDEYLNCTFNCDSTVFNNGYNLNVGCGTNINFSSKGKIVMNGGSFICSYMPDDPDPCAPVTFQGKSGVPWEGISLNECTQVNVGNIIFNNIAYTEDYYQNCAINIVNCPHYTVCACVFNITSQADGVKMMFSNIPTGAGWGDTYIYGCTFNVGNASSTPVNVVSLAGVNAPIKVENSKFYNNSTGDPLAILLSGITGGVVQSNFIHNFSTGVNVMSSSVDFFHNTIYSDKTNANGLYGLSASTLNLIPVAHYFTGGYNKITTPNQGSKCINVEYSYFDIDTGFNTFNISSNYEGETYHLFGYFNRTEQEQVPATNNCFQTDTINTNQPRVNVRWGSPEGNAVNFHFPEYSCNTEIPNEYDVISGVGLMNDTVYIRGGGQGGAFNEQLQMYNVQFKKALKALHYFPLSAFDLMRAIGGRENSLQTINYKAAYDSVCINLRKRNYSPVEDRSKYLLSNFPDNIKSIDLISKLYYATLSLDSSGNKINSLKTFYETLILNNQGKTALINRTYYFIQKCKVVLKQYQSAMQGFYSIMQQNPYSYEGLVASWDYAATNLLDSLNGHGGGESNEQLLIDNVQLEEQENMNTDIIINKTFDNMDSTKFSKQDRKVIVQNVSDVMKTSRQKQIDKVDVLQKKSNEGNKEAVKELRQLKVLNEAIKPKKPNTVFELKKVISDDIKKVFIKTDGSEKGKQNLLPQTYNLFQNYPNPFNPTTKINYELPKDGKVKLVIYDILGREIKILVNELKQAGRYTVEFNGNNFASGVYFYRIQVEGGKSYTSVKKMVLIK
jgi:hypothetical protein